jgi:glycine hydroxymethyltransferase
MHKTETISVRKDKGDQAISHLLAKEWERQESCIELIASENIASPDVLAAQGSVLTNKYAEGYPGRRYYSGCEVVDEVERLAQSRICKLLGAQYANVQPHSGSQANQAVFTACLNPGDTILGMSLDHGGHLSHGARVNLSGKWFNAIQYGIHPETHLIHYEDVQHLAKKHKPKLIIAGASAYTRQIHFERFRQIADEVGAILLADIAHIAGLVAADLHPSPFPHAHVVTTTTHKTLRGPRGGVILTNDEALMKRINSALFPGIQGGPLMHVIAGKAVAFYEALQPHFKTYMEQVLKNSQAMADTFRTEGVNLVSGGTDNHALLVDLRGTSLTGVQLESFMEDMHLSANKNAVPQDPRPPRETSGLRLGTPAATTRGFMEDDCRHIASWIAGIIHAADKGDVLHYIEKTQAKVKALCKKYPLPYGPIP